MNLKEVQGILGGRYSESPLTRKGESQASALHGHRCFSRKDRPIDLVIASTALRASETARLALRASGMVTLEQAMLLTAEIEEISQGQWEGKTLRETYGSKTLADYLASGGDLFHYRPPDGESMHDVQTRVEHFIATTLLPFAERRAVSVLSQSSDDNAVPVVTVAIFTHGIVIRMFLKHALGLSLQSCQKMMVFNTSVTQLTYSSGKRSWTLISSNEISHLDSLRSNPMSNL